MTNLATLALALAVSGLGATAVAAQDGPGRGGGRMIDLDFAAIDADGNGALSRDELAARATVAVAAIDADGDGVITRDELVAITPAMPGAGLMRPFGRSPAELRAERTLEWMEASEAGQFEVTALVERQVNGVLAVVDVNRDGAISQAEADAMRERFAERGRGHHGRGDGERQRRF